MARLKVLVSVIGLLLSIASPTSLADEIYKWVNEKGNISYGNNPPAGVDAQLVNTEQGPSESDEAEAKAISESISKATTSATAKPSPSAADETAKKEACEKAKSEYAKLASTARIAVGKDDQGRSVTADAEQRKALAEEKQAAVDRACAP